MSGLEIAASVAAIVSAFSGATSLFRSWRNDRRKSKKAVSAARDEDLETSLVKGERRTREEYDADYAKLGRAFAIGDERGRLDLLTHLTTLQSSVITLLTRAVSTGGGAPYPLDLISLLSTSDSTRHGTVSALAQQFQRLSQAAPVARQLQGTGSSSGQTWPLRSLGTCQGAVRTKRAGIFSHARDCNQCKYGYLLEKERGLFGQYRSYMDACHKTEEDSNYLSQYLCPFCNTSESHHGSAEFSEHLEYTHGRKAVRQRWGNGD